MKQLLFLVLCSLAFSLNAVKQRSKSDVIESKRVRLECYESFRGSIRRQQVIQDLKKAIRLYEQREQRQRRLQELRVRLQEQDSDSDSSSSSSESDSSSSPDEVNDSEYEWEHGYGSEIYKAQYPPSDSESSSSEDEFYFSPEDEHDCCNVL